jgi:hypothetical protein
MAKGGDFEWRRRRVPRRRRSNDAGDRPVRSFHHGEGVISSMAKKKAAKKKKK